MKKKATWRVKPELKAEDILKFDFQYYVEYEIETERNCFSNGCDGICRCSTIDSWKITQGASVSRVVKELFRYKAKDELLQYCVDRLFRLNKADDTDNYELRIGGGYYGEEVHGASFNYAQKVANAAQKLLPMTVNEKVEFILLEEYGHLIPRLTGLNYELIEVDVDKVKVPNQNYLTRINKDRVDMYEGQLTDDYPICVCVNNGNHYDLVDGYHRLTAWKKLGHKKIKIITG